MIVSESDASPKLPLPSEVPTNRLPVEDMYHGSRLAPKGVTHVHHFFLPRAAHALAAIWRRGNAHVDVRLRHMLIYFVEQAIWGMSILARYAPTHYSQVNQYLSGVFYVGSQIAEVSPQYNLGNKLVRLVKTFRDVPARQPSGCVATGSTTAPLSIPDSSVDYVFTDPPFGENIYYADLNFLVESWHGALTNAAPEAIVDRFKKKGLPEYQRLMQRCFEEYRRVLKPGRWITVVFHNSKNAVWTAIQEALLAAGFVVADVRTMDKRQGSYRQVTSSAVKTGLGDFRLQAERRLGGTLHAHARHGGRSLGLSPYPSRPTARVRSQGREGRSRQRAPTPCALRPHGRLPCPAQRDSSPVRGRVSGRASAALPRARRHDLPPGPSPPSMTSSAWRPRKWSNWRSSSLTSPPRYSG